MLNSKIILLGNICTYICIYFYLEWFILIVICSNVWTLRPWLSEFIKPRFKYTANYPEADGSSSVFRHIPTWSQDPLFPSPGPSFAILIATRCRAAVTIPQVQLLCCFGGRLKLGTVSLASCLLSNFLASANLSSDLAGFVSWHWVPM